MAESAETKIDPSSRFQLNHLSPCIGTEVLGIDLRTDTDADTIDLLNKLLVERKVLFFREQDISVNEHVAFARCFGELEIHPFTRNIETLPEVITLTNDRENPPSINIWHSDVTWRAVPSLGSILRARTVPEVGGDTLFANMEAAYEALDDETKVQLEGLIAVHDNESFLRGMEKNGASDEEVEAMRQQYPPSRHPVVRTHPVAYPAGGCGCR